MTAQSKTAEPADLEFCCTGAATGEMIDYNGHVNIGYYSILFEDAARALFRRIDISREYRERTNHALFARENHTVFEHEVLEDDELRFHCQILGLGKAAIDCMFFMFDASRGYLAATQQVLYLHVDLTARKVVPIGEPALGRLQAIAQRHASLPRPPQAGRAIVIR
jgi:acyl-CoA thioester hydrolase